MNRWEMYVLKRKCKDLVIMVLIGMVMVVERVWMIIWWSKGVLVWNGKVRRVLNGWRFWLVLWYWEIVFFWVDLRMMWGEEGV